MRFTILNTQTNGTRHQIHNHQPPRLKGAFHVAEKQESEKSQGIGQTEIVDNKNQNRNFTEIWATGVRWCDHVSLYVTTRLNTISYVYIRAHIRSVVLHHIPFFCCCCIRYGYFFARLLFALFVVLFAHTSYTDKRTNLFFPSAASPHRVSSMALLYCACIVYLVPFNNREKK